MDELCDMWGQSVKRSYQEKKKVGMNLKLSFLNSELEVKKYRMKGCKMEASGLWFTRDKGQHESQGHPRLLHECVKVLRLYLLL